MYSPNFSSCLLPVLFLLNRQPFCDQALAISSGCFLFKHIGIVRLKIWGHHSHKTLEACNVCWPLMTLSLAILELNIILICHLSCFFLATLWAMSVSALSSVKYRWFWDYFFGSTVHLSPVGLFKLSLSCTFLYFSCSSFYYFISFSKLFTYCFKASLSFSLSNKFDSRTAVWWSTNSSSSVLTSCTIYCIFQWTIFLCKHIRLFLVKLSWWWGSAG